LVKYADYLVYTPPTNFVGVDTLTFIATDEFGQTASGTATIIVLAQLAFSTSAADLGLTAAGFQVRVQSPNGINPVVIYGSTNLSDWQPLFTNPPVNGSLPFLDRVGTNFPRRFYRAVQEQ